MLPVGIMNSQGTGYGHDLEQLAVFVYHFTAWEVTKVLRSCGGPDVRGRSLGASCAPTES